jgi:predicted RNA-binding Zn ribbon-like protein
LHNRPPRYDSWDDVMSALEDDVRTATSVDETTDAAAHAAWTPPNHLGALPLHLRERAEQLLAEQRESIRNLEELYRETGRHLAAVRSVPRQADGRSVYLDVTG